MQQEMGSIGHKLKAGYCKKCPIYHACIDVEKCPRVRADLWRVTNGRKKNGIELVRVSELNDAQLSAWENRVYAGFRE